VGGGGAGALATAGVLTAGLVSFRNGNAARSQAFMRARVGLQAATVALMVATGGLEVLRSQDDVFATVRSGFSKAYADAFGGPEASRNQPSPG